MRPYKSAGLRGPATLTFGVDVGAVTLSNTLEEPGAALPLDGDSCTLDVRPFQITTLRVARQA